MQQHRSVLLTQDVFTHIDPQIQRYGEHLTIEGRVVQRTPAKIASYRPGTIP